jgi:hypothetical protein
MALTVAERTRQEQLAGKRHRVLHALRDLGTGAGEVTKFLREGSKVFVEYDRASDCVLVHVDVGDTKIELEDKPEEYPSEMLVTQLLLVAG